MKEIVLDFRRYNRLGFTVRESIDIARVRSRTRQALKRHEPKLPAQPAGAASK